MSEELTAKVGLAGRWGLAEDAAAAPVIPEPARAPEPALEAADVPELAANAALLLPAAEALLALDEE